MRRPSGLHESLKLNGWHVPWSMLSTEENRKHDQCFSSFNSNTVSPSTESIISLPGCEVKRAFGKVGAPKSVEGVRMAVGHITNGCCLWCVQQIFK